MNISRRDEVKKAFQYPLFEAIARRRTRRFPVGADYHPGWTQHASKQPPVPLSDVETALLCWAGAGITGCVTGEGGQGPTLGTWVGRTVPFACNVPSTKLFFTNDDGAFLYNPRKASKVVEIETEADLDKIYTYFKEDSVKLADERAEFLAKGAYKSTRWNVGKPGTTVFMPVIDQTEEYLNTLMILFESEGYQLLNDLKGGEPAGIGKWIKNGAVTGPVVPFSSFEFNALMLNVYPMSAMLQNISLAAEAIGLGQVVFAGYSGTMMLGLTPDSKGLGFRSMKTRDGKVNPLGLDGVLEPYCPPFYKNMEEAVDAFVKRKFGPGGVYDTGYPGVVPFKDGTNALTRFGKPSPQTISVVKDYCNYVYDTYGRFPGLTDTILLRTWVQVHHLDLEYYDKYMVKEMVNDTHRHHMERWHKPV